MTGETLALVLLAAAKWITDLGIVWLVGVCAFRMISGPADDAGGPMEPPSVDRRLVRQAGCALAVLIVAAGARLYAQTWSSFGLDEPITGELARLVAGQTRWGGRWTWQVIAVGAAVPMAALVMARVPGGWLLLGAATLGVVGTAPMTGHALAHAGGPLRPMLLQILHLLAAGVWLGALFVLLSAGLGRPGASDGAAVARLVHRYSPVALTAAAVLAATGVLTAVLYVDHIPQLWQTGYGRVLLLKTGLFGLTAGLGAFNWRWVRPQLTAAGGPGRLRRSGAAELVAAAVVLAVTAWLVHLPMPHE